MKAWKIGAICLTLMLQPACADSDPFLGTDPTQLPAAGEVDLLQWASWRTGHQGESYNELQSQTEVDYGLTDRIQLALTLEYDWSRERPPASPEVRMDFAGLAGEVIFVLLPVAHAPLGLALAVDPAFNPAERGIDFRLLLEKNIFGLQHVLNINQENVWERLGPGDWTGSSGLSFNYGVAYALAPQWKVALEFGNERGFDSLFGDLSLRQQSNTFFLGPTLQYDCELMVVTLGMQAQLPWASGRDAVHGYTPGAERFRLGLRLARQI